MDNITEFKNLADSKFEHALYRKNLQERIEAQLAVAHNGGLFKATPELITFLDCWREIEVVIKDEYNNPIKCNRHTLLADIKQAYQFAMNAWLVEFEESKKIRKSNNV
jgi:hypothetical protein